MTLSVPSDSNRLAILHLAPVVGRRSGGLGPVAMGLAQEQRIRGHQATIWCLDSPSEAAEAAKEGGLEEATVVVYPVCGPSWIGYSPAMERAVGLSQGAAYEIVHQHGIWMANSRATNRWRNLLRRPTVVAPHGTLEPYALKRSTWKKRVASMLYEAKNLRLASCLHATSHSEAMGFRKWGLQNPIAVIPNGIPAAWLNSAGDAMRFRERHAIPSDRRVLLFFSRIHPKKGLPLLFRAMASVRQSLAEWRLVIVGPDEVGHRRELEALANRLGFADSVHFLGPIFGEGKRDAFAAADLFVLPTHSENFAIVVAEALGAGVPVLTTRGAPWQELQTHRCGWWVDTRTEAIAEALLDALSRSKEELVAMGQRGRTLVTREYTWARAAEKSLRLYDWLLGRSAKPEFVVE